VKVKPKIFFSILSSIIFFIIFTGLILFSFLYSKNLFLIFVYSLIGLLPGVFIFIEGVKAFQRKMLIEDIPTSKTRSIAMGLVEISGEVVPAKNMILKSPLTKTNCVYYRLVIEEERSSGKSRVWVTIKDEEKRTYFYVKDETGLVLVDPKGAEVDVSPNFSFNSGLGKDPPDFVKCYLLANNISYQDFFGINKKMRFYEYCIAPKDKIFIMGTAGDNPFIEEGWAQSGIEDIMIQKGEGEIYYISNRSEKEILSRLKLKAIGFILLGGFIIIGSLAFVLYYT
jgi:hypothetical protein